jgi:hypothetical protein
MNIDVISIMRDEARILPYWLRHYETFATRIFVFEAGSIDNTRQILAAHPKVLTLDQGKVGLDDAYYTTLFLHYRELSRGMADWVMCVAADEFVYHPSILTKLRALTNAGHCKVQLRGYCMYADQFPVGNGQIYDEIQYGYRDKLSTKTILFNPELDLRWHPGMHKELTHNGGKPVRNSKITLLHYRYFGLEYYVNRTKKNYEGLQLAGDTCVYDPKRKQTLPDGSRGYGTWFAEHCDKLERVVITEPRQIRSSS